MKSINFTVDVQQKFIKVREGDDVDEFILEVQELIDDGWMFLSAFTHTFFAHIYTVLIFQKTVYNDEQT